MRAVNLLPREHVELKKRAERPNTVALVAAVGGGAVLLVLVAGFLLANRSVDRERQNLATAKAVLAVTPAKKMSAETTLIAGRCSPSGSSGPSPSLPRSGSASPGIVSSGGWRSSCPTTSGSRT